MARLLPLGHPLPLQLVRLRDDRLILTMQPNRHLVIAALACGPPRSPVGWYASLLYFVRFHYTEMYKSSPAVANDRRDTRFNDLYMFETRLKQIAIHHRANRMWWLGNYPRLNIRFICTHGACMHAACRAIAPLYIVSGVFSESYFFPSRSMGDCMPFGFVNLHHDFGCAVRSASLDTAVSKAKSNCKPVWQSGSFCRI